MNSFSRSRYLDVEPTTDARIIIISRLRLDMHHFNTCHARTNKADPVGQMLKQLNISFYAAALLSSSLREEFE